MGLRSEGVAAMRKREDNKARGEACCGTPKVEGGKDVRCHECMPASNEHLSAKLEHIDALTYGTTRGRRL